MLIQIGYNITVRVFDSATIVFLLRVHPSGKSTLLTPDRPRIQPKIPVEYYRDPFGNYCGRLSARTATVSLRHRAIVWDSGKTDARAPLAEAVDVGKLPPETLPFLGRGLENLRLDGPRLKRSATSSITIFVSTINRLVLIGRL
jgi:hypothetical protein